MSPKLIALVCTEMNLQPDLHYSSAIASEKLNVSRHTLYELTKMGRIDCDLNGSTPVYQGWHIAARWIRRHGLAA